MAISQLRSKRSATGSRYKNTRAKKLSEGGRLPMLTRIGPRKVKSVEGRGFTLKLKALTLETANVYDSKAKKYQKSEIVNVEYSPANRNYVRRNILTKGTIIETKAGKAVITNRPSQEGTVNAVLQ